MKTFRTNTGPFPERPYYKDEVIEQICSDALAEDGFLLKEPGRVRVDRFVEKRFKVRIIYEQLDAKVLGFTEFGPNGVEAVHIAEPEDRTQAAERRMNSTIAHEGGHGLMHAHLFVPEFDHRGLFDNDPDVSKTRVLCRDPRQRRYDGRWWEFQANRAIGALLMPKGIFLVFMQQFLEQRGTFNMPSLPEHRREDAIRAAAEIFDVNPAAAKVRVDLLFPDAGGQLTL